MKYEKSFCSYDQQADTLIARGMGGDKAEIVSKLEVVNYYRLSGYWQPYRDRPTDGTSGLLDTFVPGTKFDDVWSRYLFDRKLRLHVMDAIERIEVHARAKITHLHARKFGPFGYAENPSSLGGLGHFEYNEFMRKLREIKNDSREEFVSHFQAKYGDKHSELPIWVAGELLSFGGLLSFYRGCDSSIQKDFALSYLIDNRICSSWLKAIHSVRNICAHHSRLWNRILGSKPMIPNKSPRWVLRYTIPNERVFGVLTICNYLLGIICPDSAWGIRLKSLLNEFPDIPLAAMGFPQNWDSHQIWSMP